MDELEHPHEPLTAQTVHTVAISTGTAMAAIRDAEPPVIIFVATG